MPRLSLREVLLLVAFAAIAIALLKYSSARNPNSNVEFAPVFTEN